MNIKNINNIKPFRLKFNIKIFISHLFGIAVLLAFTNLAISYSKGEFELPFYDRNKNTVVQIDTGSIPRDRDNIASSEEKTTEDITSVAGIINPDDFVAESESGETAVDIPNDTDESADSAAAFELFSDDMKHRGFSVTDGVYEIYDEVRTNAAVNNYKTEVSKILSEIDKLSENEEDTENEKAIAELLLTLPEKPVLYEYKFVQIEPEIEIPTTSQITTSYMPKSTIETSMDYFIVRTPENEILCTASGEIITRFFDSLELEILKMRDGEGRTVFKRTDGAYFIYDHDYYLHNPTEEKQSGGGFVPIAFNELLTGSRGVPFMYPSYYGADGANNLDRDYNPYNGKWGYKDSATGAVKFLGRIYNQTFNYSENIGIAFQDSSGRGYKLFFLDENGYNYITDYNYYAPDAAKKSHLGFFYFDHGLTRVYEREFDRRNGAITERELIVNYYGTPFYIPEDYNIKAYSNGMILLEKNGYYGFMNYLGEWVANPIFTYAQPFYEGVAVVGLGNGKRAIIDIQGKFIAKFKYDIITNCTGGIIALYERNQGWTILNKVRRQIEID